MARTKAYSASAIAAALIESQGVITVAAARAGCSHDTVERYIREYPTVAAAYQQARAGIIDLAESVLIQHLKEGDLGAAKFALTTIGKDRGWGQSVDVSQTGDITIRVQYGDRDDSA